MTDARSAERRRPGLRPPPSGVVVLWLALLLLVIAGLRAEAVQEPADPGVGVSRDTAASTPAVTQPSSAQAGDAVARARAEIDTPWHERLISVVGMAFLVFVAWLLSVDRRRFPTRIVLWGTALQLAFALLILRTTPGEQFFALVNDAFIQLLGYTQDGARFIFGNLVDNNIPVGMPIGEPAATAPLDPASPPRYAAAGSFFAFTVLPTIIFFSSLMTVLYYLKVMQFVVKGVAWVMQRTLGTSGAETLSASGNIFVGQTEAPLMIKPFVDKMTMSELHCVMTGG
ncbi:MAG: Na+ dependent nucleoside transporter N-terminal domain-containing protein, partial [Gemmatimonadota bacterium]